MQPEAYQPPKASYIPVRIGGRIVFRFDPVRGVIEIQHHGDYHYVDLAAIVERSQRAGGPPNLIVGE